VNRLQTNSDFTFCCRHIGFINPNADAIAHVNNIREKAFGISPRDRLALNATLRAVLRSARLVRVVKAA
jgi:DUF1365 family protein